MSFRLTEGIAQSEAIVHPAEVVTYIDSYECQLSYNPLQMALGWVLGVATALRGLAEVCLHNRKRLRLAMLACCN